MSVSITKAVGAPETLTTGASPTDADPSVQLYYITTGGTGGDEVVNLVSPTLDLDGQTNGELIGRRVNLCLAVKTDPADVVRIAIDGDSSASLSVQQTTPQESYTGIKLTWVGACVSIVWAADGWTVDAGITDGSFSYDAQNITFDMEPPQLGDASATASTQSFIGQQITNAANSNKAGDLHLFGGATAGAGPGGDAIVQGGYSITGAGGDVKISGGTGTTAGNIIMATLPTAAPSVVGALWNNSGVLTVSAG